MIEPPAGKRNHFSYNTSISLALPEDWEEVEDPNFAALYLNPGAEEPSPKIGIRVFPVDGSQTDGHIQVGGLLDDADKVRPGYKALSRVELEVDEQPALTLVSELIDETSGQPIVQHVTIVQVSSAIYTLIGMMDKSVADEYLPVFDEAIASVRFISIEQS